MRIDAVRYESLDEAQKRLYDIIAGTRKSGLGGPFSVLVRVPHLAGPANDLHNAFRLQGKLDRDLFEMLVLMVARRHSSEFAWAVHEALALKAGLDRRIVEAIRMRRLPDMRRESERLIYDIVTQLLQAGTLCAQLYREATASLGADLLIEIVSGVGFYSMICLVLNTFEVGAPEGKTPFAESPA